MTVRVAFFVVLAGLIGSALSLHCCRNARVLVRGGAIQFAGQPTNFSRIHTTSNEISAETVPKPENLHQSPSFISLFTSTQAFFKRVVTPLTSDPDMSTFIAKTCSYAFWTYMTLCLLGTLGIDTKPVLTVFNVALITLGFGAKDLIANSFAGIFILFTRPFARGSIIRIAGYRGRVSSVDVRYLKLQDLKDKSETLIPLSVVYGSPIVIEADGSD